MGRDIYTAPSEVSDKKMKSGLERRRGKFRAAEKLQYV